VLLLVSVALSVNVLPELEIEHDAPADGLAENVSAPDRAEPVSPCNDATPDELNMISFAVAVLMVIPLPAVNTDVPN
jgi:hypothetical protein